LPALYADIADAVAAHGLALRGGFAPVSADRVPEFAPGRPAASVLMVGNTGHAMWQSFKAEAWAHHHPLDRWTREVLDAVCTRFDCRAVYPFDAPPLPFQRWAARAWPLSPSPLGLLIDAEYGLWHALRGALLFADPVDVPEVRSVASPCASCADKPCLSACPIGAFSDAGFDYVSCRDYVVSPRGAACRDEGCAARMACPVGRQHRYDVDQQQFHMRSFSGLGGSVR